MRSLRVGSIERLRKANNLGRVSGHWSRPSGKGRERTIDREGRRYGMVRIVHAHTKFDLNTRGDIDRELGSYELE